MLRLRLPLRLAALASLPLIVPGIYGQLGALAATTATAVTDRISVTAVGAGPDVVLIPGLASSGHVWDATVAHLAATHRVHIVQVAGFGGAPAGANAAGPVLDPVVAALHDYIARAKIAGAAIVGHSLGGLIAMKLAIDHPGDAGRIMIVDSLPFAGLMFGPGATPVAVEPLVRGMRDKLAAGTQEAYAAAEPAQMARLVRTTGPEAQAAIAAASASDHRVVAQALYDDMTTDVRPDLARIAVPVTMLYPWDPATGVPQATFDALYTNAFAPLRQAKVERGRRIVSLHHDRSTGGIPRQARRIPRRLTFRGRLEKAGPVH